MDKPHNLDLSSHILEQPAHMLSIISSISVHKLGSITKQCVSGVGWGGATFFVKVSGCVPDI